MQVTKSVSKTLEDTNDLEMELEKFKTKVEKSELTGNVSPKDYALTSLSIIDDAKILTSKDIKDLVDLSKELRDVFIYSQVFRTRTEMEVSVLNDLKFPTADSKYWQAIREQNVMFTELVMLSYEYRKLLVQTKMKEEELKSEKNINGQELIRIEIDKNKFLMLNMQKTAKDRIRELREWHEIKEGLIPNMQYSLKDVNEHQLLSYARRFINEILVSGENGSPAERQNIIGLLNTTLKTVKEKGLENRLLNSFDEKTRGVLKSQFMIEGNDDGVS